MALEHFTSRILGKINILFFKIREVSCGNLIWARLYVHIFPFFLSIIKRKSKYMNVATETQIKEKEDPKTFSLTLTGEQRKYLTYTGIALA